ncbi:hypothetical protein NFJ02_26g61650 [Pycnococcus provasolii]
MYGYAQLVTNGASYPQRAGHPDYTTWLQNCKNSPNTARPWCPHPSVNCPRAFKKRGDVPFFDEMKSFHGGIVIDGHDMTEPPPPPPVKQESIDV